MPLIPSLSPYLLLLLSAFIPHPTALAMPTRTAGPLPTPPPLVFTNHPPNRPAKPEPPPPPDRHGAREARGALRGFGKRGFEVIGPDLDQREEMELVGRQSWNTTYPPCNNVGNNVLSCYPTQGLTLVESEWTKFVWNLRQPQFIGAGTVDAYLFHADSDEIAQSFPGLQNAAGQLGLQVNDLWWGDRGNDFDGENVTFPYYFVVVPGGTSLTGGESRLATFLAIQTATPQTLISASSVSVTSVSFLSTESAASLTSVESVSGLSASSIGSISSVSVTSVSAISTQSVESAASFSSALSFLSELSVASPAAFSSLSTASTASFVSESSRSAVSAESTSSVYSVSATSRAANSSTPVPGSTPSGDLQGAATDNGGTPAWAIAVPVVLGLLALIFFCALLFLGARFLRTRRKRSRRGSIGSQSPMMANVPGDPSSKPPKPPTILPAAAAGAATAAALGGTGAHSTAPSRNTSTTARPGATTVQPHEPMSPTAVIAGAAAAAAAAGPSHNPDQPLSSSPTTVSRSTSGGLASPFSGVDAAIMARAFREALNKPDFGSSPVEEGSSGSGSGPNSQESGVPQAESPDASNAGHGTEEGGGPRVPARVGQMAQEEGGRVRRVGEERVRVEQGPPSGEG